MNQKKLNQALKDLQAICQGMNWVLGLPAEGAAGEGFLIGSKDFMLQIHQALGEMDVYELPKDDEKINTTKRGPTFH